MTISFRTIIALTLSLGAALALSACNDEITAPTGTDEPFSMYGILNPRLNTQTLLVSPIELLLGDLPDEIDAQVYSTDLATGETIAWRDSVVRGERGQTDHVFVRDFRARFGGEYRIEVVRSDGAMSSVVARTPGEIMVDSRDLGIGFFEVSVEGEAFHILEVEVIYSVRRYDKFTAQSKPGAFCNSPNDTYSVPYSKHVLPTEGGYRFRVDMRFDHERVLGEYLADYGPLSYVPSVAGLALMNVTIRLLIAHPEWNPPSGGFNANVLSNPDVMTNVTNGYGFVAGGYNEDRSVFPGEDGVDATHFFDFLMRPPSRCTDYCNCGL